MTYPSSFWNKQTGQYAAAELSMHPSARWEFDLPRKDGWERIWFEIAWPENGELQVRTLDDPDVNEDQCRTVIKIQYPTRADFLRAMKALARQRGFHYIDAQADADLVPKAARRLWINMGGEVVIPELDTCSQIIHAQNATALTMPKLKRCGGYIHAPAARLSIPAMPPPWPLTSGTIREAARRGEILPAEPVDQFPRAPKSAERPPTAPTGQPQVAPAQARPCQGCGGAKYDPRILLTPGGADQLIQELG